MKFPRIIFIVGPTAVGKSDVAYHLAQKLDGEIISCDSMQIYREINIASNKPSEEVLKNVPHHLINIASIKDEFDAVRFSELAVKAIEEIHYKGKTPIVVGGSGMYMQILLDGIFEGSDKDEALRERLRTQAKEHGEDYLYQQLKKKDPQAALKIHPHDQKRIVRALEVCELQGKPMSEIKTDREGIWGKYNIEIYCLDMNREDLKEKINHRVDQMFDQGLVKEVQSLNGQGWSHTAQNIIGVKEVQGYLREEFSLDEAKERMKTNTRQFAKRQLTWFRKDKRLKWINITTQNSPERIAQSILS